MKKYPLYRYKSVEYINGTNINIIELIDYLTNFVVVWLLMGFFLILSFITKRIYGYKKGKLIMKKP